MSNYKLNFIIAMAFTGIATLLLGLFIYFKNGRNKVNLTFALYSLSISWWSLTQIGNVYGPSLEASWFWARIEQVGVVFIPTFFLHFVVVFIGLKREWLLRLCYAFSIIIAFLSLTTTLICPRAEYKFGLINFGDPGPLYFLIIVFFGICVTYSLWKLLELYKISTGFKKNQLKYLLFPSLLGYLGGASSFLLVYDVNIYPLNPFGTYFICLYAIAVAYSIVRYRLMDINVALTRAGIFVIVYTLVLGIPFWFGIKTGLWVYSTVIMAVLATTGPLTYSYLRNRAENILFKERRRYQEVLTNLSKSMVDIRDIEELPKTINSTVVDAVKIKFAAIYLKQEEYKSFQLKSCYPQEAKSRFPELIPWDDSLIGILNQRQKPLLDEEVGPRNKIDPDLGLIIPCFSKDGLLGFIVLGAKHNNQMYTDDDLLSFENLSYAASLAIENCIFWKEIEDRQRKARLQEMDTFSYSLAHEIDNPMTIVYNLARFQKEHFLKYVTDPEERKDVEEACNIMMEGSGRVMSMVKAIRQFGQKVSGELEPLNLQEIIEGFSRLYSPELKANCVVFLKEIPEEPIYVQGVAAELQQVLMIFAKNAIHAMKYSLEKRLTLKVTRVNHSTVRIAVSDTGYGVKKGNLQTIFAPFFTSKASTEGTGMGLHNAKGFILRHNGRIWAESEGENKGSAFILELPVIQGVQPESIKKEESKTKWAF
ncbi:MAG: ATP-binding protein [Candidatus Omnitrophica bacterium]|nr:ATP-binding protein [Candidatus Omnitrophota bacterium]